MPVSKTTRSLFKQNNSKRSGGYFLEGAVRYRICNCWFAELNGSWFRHDGRTLVCVVNKTSTGTCAAESLPTVCGEKFRVKLPSFGFGFKYFYDYYDDCLSFFGGAGLKVFFLRITPCGSGSSCCVWDSKNSIGGALGVGLQYKPFRNLLLEGFVDYLIKSFSSGNESCCGSSCRFNVSGFVVGIGIGAQF